MPSQDSLQKFTADVNVILDRACSAGEVSRPYVLQYVEFCNMLDDKWDRWLKGVQKDDAERRLRAAIKAGKDRSRWPADY